MSICIIDLGDDNDATCNPSNSTEHNPPPDTSTPLHTPHVETDLQVVVTDKTTYRPQNMSWLH